MRRLALMFLTVLAALVACGGPSATAPSTAPTTKAPITADQAAYLDGLREINPGLVVNPDRAIRRATNICLDIEEGMTEPEVVRSTVARLSGSNATIDAPQAAQAVELAKRHICEK
ncbi:MAG: DUF732 domain-containing protein [Pseudonocardia sp.]